MLCMDLLGGGWGWWGSVGEVVCVVLGVWGLCGCLCVCVCVCVCVRVRVCEFPFGNLDSHNSFLLTLLGDFAVNTVGLDMGLND